MVPIKKEHQKMRWKVNDVDPIQSRDQKQGSSDTDFLSHFFSLDSSLSHFFSRFFSRSHFFSRFFSLSLCSKHNCINKFEVVTKLSVFESDSVRVYSLTISLISLLFQPFERRKEESERERREM